MQSTGDIPREKLLQASFTWRVLINATAADVYRAVSTDEGRAGFWVATSRSTASGITLEFFDGTSWTGRMLRATPDRAVELTYLGGGTVVLEILPVSQSQCIVAVTDRPTNPVDWLANYAGWVAVLLNLKATAEFGVDLRNRDGARSFEQGFVDG